MIRNQSLYLKVGDRVYHKRFIRWGMGVVVEERVSELPGGFCYVRINFQDGQVRVFDNNFRSECCCYYAGIEKIDADTKYIVIKDNKNNGNSPKRRKALSKGKD
jgi:hypothetical protein